MRKTLTVFSIFAIVGLFTADIFAQPIQGRRPGRARMNQSSSRILRVLKDNQEKLKVTEDQLKAIEDLTYSFELGKIEARSKASKQRLEIRKLMKDRENLDYEQLKMALSKASEYRHDMLIDGLKLREEVGKILTPEQKEALKTMRQERFKDRREVHRQDERSGRMQRPPLNRQRIKENF
jgi:Spy/CpxP family protein refolding chaperone